MLPPQLSEQVNTTLVCCGYKAHYLKGEKTADLCICLAYTKVVGVQDMIIYQKASPVNYNSNNVRSHDPVTKNSKPQIS